MSPMNQPYNNHHTLVYYILEKLEKCNVSLELLTNLKKEELQQQSLSFTLFSQPFQGYKKKYIIIK